jgi:SAM-dependent methyltransferase
VADPSAALPGDVAAAELARYYDLDLVDDPGDVDLYLALAEARAGPILELAAGTGRVAVPLAAAGHEVVALDNDRHMLDRARARWASASAAGSGRGSLDLVADDMISYRPAGRYGLVLIAFNSLLLLDRDDQRAALATAAQSLARGGAVVIDVWLPAPEDLALYDGRLVLDWVRRDEERGEWVSKTTSARYSAGARTADVTTMFDAWGDTDQLRRTLRRDRISFLTPTELRTVARDAGLHEESSAGDYALTPFLDDSDRLVLICRAGPD